MSAPNYEPEFLSAHKDANEGPRLTAFTHFVWKFKIPYLVVFVLVGVGLDQVTKIWAQGALAKEVSEARWEKDEGPLDDNRYTLMNDPKEQPVLVQLSKAAQTKGTCNKKNLRRLRSPESKHGYRLDGTSLTLDGDCEVTNASDEDVAVVVRTKVPGFLHANTIVVIPKAFNFRYAENRAAAFSLTSSIPAPIRRPLLVVVASLAMLLLLGWFLTMKQPDGILQTALLCIVCGAVGNLIDRVRLGYVIDFIDWRAGFINEKWPPWPTFNIADVFIVVGAGLVILRTLKPLYPEDQDDKNHGQAEDASAQLEAE
mgnify:CR=1 FL=1